MYLPKAILAVFTLLLLVATALTGLHAAMMTDGHGNMSSCPLMNGDVSFCKMGIMEHLSTWQSFFAAIMLNVVSVFLVFTLLLIGISSEVDEKNRHGTINFLYNKRHNFIASIFNFLRLALSDGILHPKLYDFRLISY